MFQTGGVEAVVDGGTDFPLLALTAGLFDPVPMEKVKEAQGALQKAAVTIPAEIAGRFITATKFSDADHKIVLDIATRALTSFQPVEPKPALEANS